MVNTLGITVIEGIDTTPKHGIISLNRVIHGLESPTIRRRTSRMWQSKTYYFVLENYNMVRITCLNEKVMMFEYVDDQDRITSFDQSPWAI